MSPVSPAGERPADLDLRSGPERRLRRAWREGAGPLAGAASLAYGAAAGLRGFLWDVGLLRARRTSIPVVSVGGLTVGGSGKTPLAAALADGLEERGRRPGIVTHGYEDELEVHRRLGPGRPVEGGRDRLAAVERTAARGAGVAVVDSGLQHRRLERAVEVVALGARDLRARARLPAGPLREGWSALGRADAVVLTRRPGDPPPPRGLPGWLRERLPDAVAAACEIRPAGLEPANRRAREATTPDPAAALASVMHPEPFFRALTERGLAPEVRVRLPDHGRPDPDRLAALTERAGSRGIVGTLKDVVKLEEPVDEATPLWHLRDEVAWTAGRSALLDRIEAILEETP